MYRRNDSRQVGLSNPESFRLGHRRNVLHASLARRWVPRTVRTPGDPDVASVRLRWARSTDRSPPGKIDGRFLASCRWRVFRGFLALRAEYSLTFVLLLDSQQPIRRPLQFAWPQCGLTLGCCSVPSHLCHSLSFRTQDPYRSSWRSVIARAHSAIRQNDPRIHGLPGWRVGMGRAVTLYRQPRCTHK